MTEHLLELATDVAREAGELLAGYADHHDLRVRTKSSDTDPVSEADTASERLITRRLLDARPDDGMLGEEDADNRRGTTGVRWVVDPLDGTVNYLYGRSSWCVSIAAEDEHGVIVGVVHDPTHGETFTARRGYGAACNGHPLAVSAPPSLAQTLLATGFAYDVAVRRDWARIVAALLGEVRDVRRGGSAALDLAWTAAGRVDAYLEFALQPWDWAAGQLIAAEAGAHVTPMRRVLGGVEQEGLLVAGETVHRALGEWLATVG